MRCSLWIGVKLELLEFKNRQMEMPTFTLMKDQALTKVIQMFPPKRFILFAWPCRTAGRRVLRGSNGRPLCSTYAVRMAGRRVLRGSNGDRLRRTAGRRVLRGLNGRLRNGGNIWMALVTAWSFISVKVGISIWRFLNFNSSRNCKNGGFCSFRVPWNQFHVKSEWQKNPDFPHCEW